MENVWNTHTNRWLLYAMGVVQLWNHRLLCGSSSGGPTHTSKSMVLLCSGCSSVCMECDGIRMEYAWNMSGILMEYVQITNGICMEYHGVCMEYAWNTYGICMEYGRNTHGTHIESDCFIMLWCSSVMESSISM